MAPYLWPRMEVLQLVSPQFANSGRQLTISSALSLITILTKNRGADGSISFAQWFVVAKNHLKWNDNCIHLFWDILCMCSWYMKNTSATENSSSQMNVDEAGHGNVSQMTAQQTIDFEYLVIFLILHVNDAQSKHTSASQFTYDTMWPAVESSALGGGGQPHDRGYGTAASSGATSPTPTISASGHDSMDGSGSGGRLTRAAPAQACT